MSSNNRSIDRQGFVEVTPTHARLPDVGTTTLDNSFVANTSAWRAQSLSIPAGGRGMEDATVSRTAEGSLAKVRLLLSAR
jgi:hypothetical protein